ncbi:MAG: transposase [Chloroflexales bacterium]|nr:transposase [Chloroflexales bacterium]
MGSGTRYSRSPLDAKKKSLIASERDAWTRAFFAVAQTEIVAEDVVVLDEFGSNVDMTPRYARAPAGERAVASVPRTTPTNTTTIASLTTKGMGPALSVSGGVDRLTFEAYLEQVLGPSLRAGQIVILDNLSAHKGGRIEQLVAARGCRLLYLPTYSPDFSPIELAFAKVKPMLRRIGARTRELLHIAIGQALEAISADDAAAFFRHCGYRFPPDWNQCFCS